ncbi:MATE family efflux transporter [Halomarina oriensis]|uniref:MATE family efflux transporter n=1 Tax=Halomarina oriensis TaxID=671145 RepID=UPI0034A0DF5C
MSSVPNPIRLVVAAIGSLLVRLGLLDDERARRTADLAWPRIVTGIARMSRSAVDVAMVGTALGTAAIGGVGLASPFWGLAFAVGGGIAAGSIALISQRFGGRSLDGIGQAVRSSAAVVVLLTLPLVAAFWTFAPELVGLLSDERAVVDYGSAYLRVVSLGVPFAALNLIGSRVFIGVDDAWTPMVVRSGGAISNIAINAVLIFGFDMGVVGAALGTVLSNVLVTAVFAGTLVTGRLPGVGEFPVRVDPFGPYLSRDVVRQLVTIGLPVIGRNGVWTVAEFPMLAIAALYGQEVLAAFVIARRIWGLMNTPGWGFGLASSSLVGQELGAGHETTAESYGREIIRYAVAVYVLSGAIVFVLADPIVLAFVDDPTARSVPVATTLVRVACLAIVFQGISGGSAGPLDASGDTHWPFASQFLGMFCCSIPIAYLGATTALGILGLYLAFVAETAIPAALNYYRFRSNVWKRVSRDYRPGATPADD